LHDVGCYNKAWKAHYEEEYLFRQGGNWLDVADSAYRAGERDLAWGFLMKAAVFGDDELYKQTLETAKLWSDVEAGKTELPKPQPLAPEERKSKFKQIVMAYKDMNAHPRAWTIIDEYKNEFDDPEGLKKEIQDDWLDLTNMLCSPGIARRVVLYGYELLRIDVAEDGTRTVTYPNKPLDVKIPWIYPEGWQEAAQKMLDEEMKKLGVAPDRLRTWHTDGGSVSFKAKFVSFVDGKVTLEKEGGTTIVLAINELMQGDQNFVRYCFGTKPTTP
jgi:hypothetical protein